jgi:hypothetical protein
MRVSFLSISWRRTRGLLVVLTLLSGTALAQAPSTFSDGRLASASLNSTAVNPVGPVPAISSGAVATSPAAGSALPEAPEQHRFWDNENRALFVTVAALCAADFVVTRANLQRGGKELDPVTRLFSGSTAGLAANFAGEAAGIIGLSYYFHKTGHHRLERITPLLNIGASSFAVAYDLNHR